MSPQHALELQNSFCDGLYDLVETKEAVRFFAPLTTGERVKNFEARQADCVGLHVGINEAGRQGLICFYFVEVPKATDDSSRSGIVLLSLIRDREQLAGLFDPTKLASLLRTSQETAANIIESLKRDFLSFQRLKLMYGIYEFMKK